MNTNKIAEASVLLTSRAANLAVMQALTDSWNALTDQQRADFTSNVGDYDTVTVAISMGGTSARLVTDEWHEEIEEDNAAVAEYLKNLETILNDLDGDAQYMGELWDGANPEESYRPLYYSQGDLDTARNMYQIALDHMAETIAAAK